MPLTSASIAAEAAFRARLAELGAALLEPTWLGAMVPHRVRCAAGHDCTPRPANAQRLGICRACVGNDPATAEAAFRARLAELGATLLEPVWLGNHAPHRAQCAAGHDCSPRPLGVRSGQGICRACAGNDPATAEAAFRARLAELGATLLEPTYLGANRLHRVRCAAGHDCLTLPASVQQGHSPCRACIGLDPATAEAAFRARLAELGATLLEPTYLGSKKPHRVRCAAGHDCAPTPNNVRNGGGICRACAGQVWDVFYVVTADELARVKFGITSGDPRPRLSEHRRAGYRTITRLLTGLPADTAVQMERAAIATLALAGIKPVHGREWFDIGALAVVLDITDNWNGRTGHASAGTAA
jgi:single CXXC unit